MAISSVNVRRLRGGLWVATLGFVVMSGLRVVNLYETFKAGGFDPRGYDHFRSIVAEAENVPVGDDSPKTPPLQSLSSLWQKPLNGYEPPKVDPVETEPEEEVSAVEPIEEKVELVMISEDSRGGGLVTVMYKDEIEVEYRTEKLLGVGDALKYPYDEEPYFAKVKSISPMAVVFEWGGEDAELRLPKRQDTPTEGGDPLPSGVALSDEEEDVLSKYAGKDEGTRIPELSSGSTEAYMIGTDDRDRIVNNENYWVDMVRLGPVAGGKDGRSQLAFKTVRPHVQRTYGVQTGDILISINGAPVTSKNQAIQWVRSHPDEPKYEVLMLRNGREVTRVFYPPKD